jgi:hypothetical protein
MAEASGKPATIRVRGSRAQIEAVKQTAERAGLQLAREQDDSVSQVAQTLAQITQNEDLAQVEGRLMFVERQLERLVGRREESDQLIDSELAVMRARLEDALRAFAGITQEHKDTLATVERRVATIASEADRRNRQAVEALRVDLSEQMEQVSRSAEGLRATMLGEKRAFEEDAAQRASALAGSIAQGRQVLEARIRSATVELTERVDAVIDAIAADHPGREELLSDVQARVDEWLAEPLDAVQQLHADLADAHAAAKAEVDGLRVELSDGLQASEEKALGAALHLESIIHQVRRRLVGDEAEWTAVVGEAGEATTALRSRVEDLLSRVLTLEAAAASERGSWTAQVENLESRLDTHESWARVTVTEVSELSLRFNTIESRLGAADELRAVVEEQAGTIDYLKHRLSELEARQDAAALRDALRLGAGPGPGAGASSYTANGNGHGNGIANGANGSNGHANGANGSNGHANGANGSNGHANGIANGSNGHANGSNGHGFDHIEASTFALLLDGVPPERPGVPEIFWPAEDMEEDIEQAACAESAASAGSEAPEDPLGG